MEIWEKTCTYNDKQSRSLMERISNIRCDSKESYIHTNNLVGEEIVKFALNNKLVESIDGLTAIIKFNPKDERHYLNRCYCYLRLNENFLALADAEHIIQNGKKVAHRFIAYLRAGQALYALQKFSKAEIYFKQAVDINPENHHVKRELLCTKVAFLVNMGYKERDAILTLEKYPDTLEALYHLSNDNTIWHSKVENNFKISCNNFDDLEYTSDDEEKPNNVELVNKILNYVPGKVKFQHIAITPWDTSYHTYTKTEDKDSKDMPSLTLNNSIWIGNVTSNISNDQLKEAFSQFGSIIYIYRPYNVLYAFVYFKEREAVKKALAASTCTVGSIVIRINLAHRAQK